MPGTNPFSDALKKAAPIILDGGLATELEAQGAKLHESLWSAAHLHSDPEAIVKAHLAYLEAGASCIISASYQATRKGLMTLGISADEADALIVRSVGLAQEARDRFVAANPQAQQQILIAASIGPYGAALHDGSEYVGAYGVSKAALREFHEQRLHLLDASGADVLACETIPDFQEIVVLCELLRTVTTPAWVSFSCADGQHISDGTAISDCAALFIDHPKVLALGVNCTPPQYIPALIGELKAAATDKAIIVYPNSGERYEAETNTWHGTSTPVECALAAQEWLRAGAKIIGGCCRMGPKHIRQMHERIAKPGSPILLS
ncbi:MAG: homocysteine S-methyltransferase [Gammaproteobacteria bacterium]|nr:homocysteine S-methyltransferase [Gammaproteobacteria bacterium]MDH4314713.1 homocysteine S-methyltransferase [Gammaproteobacteria bacterium]MDH5214555.1 homocysteine S-methyltransferase [Gammaproteobacteria bacterium]MDH5499836.1 homocysteine S-methyltransferase [Gammaproteobacteria bacterium]